MSKEKIENIWDGVSVQKNLIKVYNNNSEIELLQILKQNSFLFYELVERKASVQPIFHEINFGGNMRCDFAWLNNSSDGPEWVLVEVERPRLDLFTAKKEPTQLLNHGLEQLKSWNRYFNENPGEKKRIFGAVAQFRFILVGGTGQAWKEEHAAKWRIEHNRETKFEIRSSEAFIRPLEILNDSPELLWSFAENPKTLNPGELAKFWTENKYMDNWRKLIS